MGILNLDGRLGIEVTGRFIDLEAGKTIESEIEGIGRLSNLCLAKG